MKTQPLLNLLNKNSGYFSSLGFLAVLLTLTFFLPEIKDPQYSWVIYLLQGTLFTLLLFCLIPFYEKLEESKAKVIQIFKVFIVLLMICFISYLISNYENALIGALAVATVIFGFVTLSKAFKILIKVMKKKRINFKIIKKNWFYFAIFLIFLAVLILNIKSLFFDGTIIWRKQFSSIGNFDSVDIFLSNILTYFSIGFMFWIVLSTLRIILLALDKVMKKAGLNAGDELEGEAKKGEVREGKKWKKTKK